MLTQNLSLHQRHNMDVGSNTRTHCRPKHLLICPLAKDLLHNETDETCALFCETSLARRVSASSTYPGLKQTFLES